MAFKLLTGPYLNHLTRCASTPTMTPSALTLFPVTNALDNRSSKPAIFGTASSDSTITADLNLLLGEFESSGQTATWTMLGVGAIAATSGTVYSGSWSGLLSPDVGGGASEGIAYRDVTVRSGEELNFFAALWASYEAQIRIRNRQTGNWLSTGSTWGSTQGDVLSSAATTDWITGSLKFNVEPLSTCITDTVTLRVYLRAYTQAAYFDQVELWPSVNWCSIHGHNIPPAITPYLEYSNATSSWTTHSTMTLRRDSFYVNSTGLESHRYWRVRLGGTIPDTATRMFFGEVVLGQSYDVLHNPTYGGTLTWTEKQTRLDSDLGEAFIFQHNQQPQRQLGLSLIFPTDAEYQQVRDEIYRGSRGGANLCVIAPTEMDNSVVILGRIRESIQVAKNTPLERTSSLEILESPLPNDSDVAAVYDAPVTGGG